MQVTGFDFSDAETNAVYATPSAHGNMLIITIPVKLNTYGFGGNNVPSNTSGTSGIYASAEAQTAAELFVAPNVNIPIRYEIASENQTIYLGNAPEFERLLAYADGYEPDGVNNAYVDILYTLKDSTGVVLGNCSIAAGEFFETWTWTGGMMPTPKPADCTTYTLSCEVTPSSTIGTDSLGNEPVEAVTVTPQAPAVHVLKPGFTVTANDVWTDYGVNVGLQEWGTAENGIAVGDTWADDHSDHTAIPGVSGVKPSVTDFALTFAQVGTSDGLLNGAAYTTGEKDADFNVTGLTCKVGGVSYAAPAGALTVIPAVEGDTGHDFTIHINHFNMTITKTLTGNNSIYTQSFLFTVSDGSSSFQVAIPAKDFGTGNQASKTVTRLVCGKNYTVTEKTDWSWRYALASSNNIPISKTNDPQISRIEPGAYTAASGFTNHLDDDKWLSGGNSASNVYNKKG